MALNLTVKSNNLQESLDQFVKGELLDGDNAYFCEKCQAKRNTIKRMCIRKLPQTLVLQLKRFHFDWETNRAVKFDDFFEFPWTLDMSPYTTEGIQRRESVSSSSKAKFGGTQINVSSQQYELVGVVVHSGQANAGHYYSYIKDRKTVNGIPSFVPRAPTTSNNSSTSGATTNGPTSSGGGGGGVRSKWFKFNDTTVESFEMSEESLATECFGGMYKVR